MKKHIKLHTRLLTLLTLIALGVTSCSESFLKEELETQRNFSYLEEEAGIQQIAVGAYYQVFASPFATEYQYGTTNYGTDEFHAINMRMIDPNDRKTDGFFGCRSVLRLDDHLFNWVSTVKPLPK